MAEITDSSFLRRPAFTVKSNRSCSATACSIFQICIYGLLTALTVFYLAYFAYANSNLPKHDGSQKHCLLFAKSDNSGSSGSCSFFLGGTGVCVGLLILLLVLNIFSALCGKWSVCMKVLEISILLLSILVSISTSLVLSIGYHYSCSKLKNWCDGNFHERLAIIEPIAWTVTAAVIVVCLVQLLSCVFMCCRRSRYEDEDMYDHKALLSDNNASKVYT